MRFRQLECGSDKKNMCLSSHNYSLSIRNVCSLFAAAKPRRHSLGIGFSCSRISDSTCLAKHWASSFKTNSCLVGILSRSGLAGQIDNGAILDRIKQPAESGALSDMYFHLLFTWVAI